VDKIKKKQFIEEIDMTAIEEQRNEQKRKKLWEVMRNNIKNKIIIK